MIRISFVYARPEAGRHGTCATNCSLSSVADSSIRVHEHDVIRLGKWQVPTSRCSLQSLSCLSQLSFIGFCRGSQSHIAGHQHGRPGDHRRGRLRQSPVSLSCPFISATSLWQDSAVGDLYRRECIQLLVHLPSLMKIPVNLLRAKSLLDFYCHVKSLRAACQPVH